MGNNSNIPPVDDRALFEATMLAQFGEGETFDRDADGCYVNRSWHDAYIGWQALRSVFASEAAASCGVRTYKEAMDAPEAKYRRSNISSALFFADEEIAELRKVNASLHQALRQAATPSNAVIVPVEATSEMIAAAENVDELYRRGRPWVFSQVWRAMLDASPLKKNQ
jgi:hypothetical protein